MVRDCNSLHRNLLLAIAVATVGSPSAPAASAKDIRLLPTPAFAESPFYPDPLPADRDNDLLPNAMPRSPGAGEIAQLSGRILWQNGKPVAGATIEIWQCDAKGIYLPSGDRQNQAAGTANSFQGFGTFTTSATGEYRFRTLKPVVDSNGLAPRIHYKVKVEGREFLTSQIFIRDEPLNRRDSTFTGLRSLLDRELVLCSFEPHPEAKGEWIGRFDIVLPDIKSSSSEPKR